MKIYMMNVQGIDLDDKTVYEKLSEKRIEKVNRLKKDTAKRQSIAAELLLNIAMEEEKQGIEHPVKWDTDKNGKPYLIDYPDIYMNLTHSKDYAACVISDKSVGVDIQYMRDVDMKIANRFFAPDEQEHIKNAEDKKSAFYELWVRKESLVKAVGTGLRVPLDSFSVLEDVVSYGDSNYKFKMHNISDDEYKMCICEKI